MASTTSVYTNGTNINGFHTTNGDSGPAPIVMDTTAEAVVNGHEANGNIPNNGGSSFSGHVQVPVAVVSMACRLPNECHTPNSFWKFLEEGKIALNTPPGTRFSLETHYNGSLKPQTMASPGGMFLQGVDLRDIDAQFFKLSGIEATSMDPQQRQLLEVVYEGLENAGITLDEVSGSSIGCFVSSFASDYGDMQARDPENRAAATMIGVGRAMLSNRISHFLNIKGPSMTIDTACSGSLIGLDLAMRYLQTREISSAIVAGANLYASPEHVMDHYMGANGTASLSGKCHTFDVKADGYIKAEAVNMVYLKRLDDAIRDRDPIRAIIRGTATNSDGWTAGIASPNPKAQSAVIRQAYKNAGIADLSKTSYVEFHGTGTRAGDSLEAEGVTSVFAPYFQSPKQALRIGSVKSNIGHSEPAAGLSGLLKTVLSLEKGIIPGNPTFKDPSPKINFDQLRIWTSRTATQWPEVPLRRASINSFGYGGSNAHAIVDEAKGIHQHHISSYANADDEDDDFMLVSTDGEQPRRPYLLTLSANDEKSLGGQFEALDRHLSDPAVRVDLRDLAYTLGERRSRHYWRGFIISDNTENLDRESFVRGHIHEQPPKLGLVFTGQGAQWPEMGKALLETFPIAAATIKHLDEILQQSHEPPTWTLYDELTSARSAEHMRRPEFSQPLVTALQLSMLAVYRAAKTLDSCRAVVGHSSGEVAAAAAAGLITDEQAIQVAYYRGKAVAAVTSERQLGMMAVGMGSDDVLPYLKGTGISIACFNSPQSVTLSGAKSELGEVERRVKDAGRFARLLLVDAAYHSSHMLQVAEQYRSYMKQHIDWTPPADKPSVVLFSSTTGKHITSSPEVGPDYWVQNMVSPVLFDGAAHDMITSVENDESLVDCLVELGPSNALSGPVNQVKKAASSAIEYIPAWKRGENEVAIQAMLSCVGKLFTMGCPMTLIPFNQDHDVKPPVFISDLPNYAWNHSTKYWHESDASHDWRYRQFVHHDLLGSKVLGAPWDRPVWRNVLRLEDVTWLRDHQLGDSVIFPAAGYMAMAMEAMFQKAKSVGQIPSDTTASQLRYRLRNVTFPRMLTLEDRVSVTILLTLNPCLNNKDTWHEFTISTTVSRDSTAADANLGSLMKPNEDQEHCTGLVMVSLGDVDTASNNGSESELSPLKHAVPGSVWYRAMRKVGYVFGPAFQPCEQIEARADARNCRAIINFNEPKSKYPQSQYIMHPVAIDGCLQIATVALNRGHRSALDTLMPPRLIDDLEIFPVSQYTPQNQNTSRAYVSSEAIWGGVGRPDDNKRFVSDIRAYAEGSGELRFRLQGLRYHAINATAEKPHAFTQVVWAEDIDFMSTVQLAHVLLPDKSEHVLQKSHHGIPKLASLIAHKRPLAKLIEISCDENGRSLWLDELRNHSSPVAKGCAYTLCLPSHQAELQARENYAGEGNIQYLVHDGHTLSQDRDDKYDLVIFALSRGHFAEADDLSRLLDSANDLLTDHGYVTARVAQPEPDTEADSHGQLHQLVDEVSLKGLETLHRIGSTAPGSPYTVFWSGHTNFNPRVTQEPDSNIHVVSFKQDLTTAVDAVMANLAVRGWKLTKHSCPFPDIPKSSTIVVLDEIFSPVLTELTDSAFAGFRHLVEQECRILWVTKGSQMTVTHPENGLIFGTARSLGLEFPTNTTVLLDVESHANTKSLDAIETGLKYLESFDHTNLGKVDVEFVERNGIFHISRVTEDEAINHAERVAQDGAEMETGLIHGHNSIIRLVSERPGTLDTLVYAEIPDVIPLEDDEVEIEVHAAGMNFKDLANAMAFVPANERLMGLECAGIVTEVGKDVSTVKPGDRVLLVRRDGGCFGNRVRNRWHAVHLLEDWISFEDATTLGIAVHTAVYGLIFLANVQKGQTVLIHSASGGVGLAALDLCKYLGAEVYVTVGTEAKRSFLEENYGVSRDRMFSSRSTSFADELMQATGGRGVDVCLNSLTGDLLHESWRCIAEGGTLIEIGKKDLIDRKSLSMEPFDRNCSYRALDLSRRSITDEATRKCGELIMDLIRQKHIRPLHICKVFPFEETVEAFRYMQRGRHIGKVVISFAETNTVPLPFRPAVPQLRLRADGSYLIAGGFKGLCGNLAVYLARNGAKNLVTISRGGYQDERSQKTIYDCNTLGCTIDLVVGDITHIEDVRRAYQTASMPIVGVIQGAMVIRDRMFHSMTPQEFRDPIGPKIKGTYNLHTAAQEQAESGGPALDFFTMLSSVSGLLGHMGQANYAAGNAFQDAFAAYRLQQNLPAMSVDLGPVEEIGYLGDKDSTNRKLQSSGWQLVNEALLYRIIRVSILQQTHGLNPTSTGALVTGIDPKKPHFAPLHRFSALRPAHGSVSAAPGAGTGSASSATAGLLAILKSTRTDKDKVDKSTVLAAATVLVNTVLTRSLGMAEPLEPTRNLADYGVDSLVAVEMRNWARMELDVELSALEIVGSRTLVTLCELLLKRMG